MSREYFNRQAGSWDEIVAEKDTAKLEKLVTRLNIKTGSTLLDVGTGTGVLLPFLVRVVGQTGRIFGLDYAELMLKQAVKKHGTGNISYLLADIASIPVKAAIFDTVVCYSSFPHFTDKQRVLAEIQRTMKPDGQLFICHSSGREHINRIHRNIPSICHDLLPENGEMKKLLTDAGFAGICIDDGTDSYLAAAVCLKL
jgi:ubiquinone/menaquinone biosynthesis C-methylase UbiE